MSQAPNNPFDTGNNQLGQTAQQGSKTWVWVLGIIGVIFLVGALVCCGGVYYMWNQASGLVAETMVEEYGDDPVVVEKIGEITDTNFNLGATGTESSKDEDITAIVLEVTGDKGSGRLIQRTTMSTGEVSVVLVVDGEEFPLDVVDEFEEYADVIDGFEEFEAMDEGISIEEPGTDEPSAE